MTRKSATLSGYWRTKGAVLFILLLSLTLSGPLSSQPVKKAGNAVEPEKKEGEADAAQAPEFPSILEKDLFLGAFLNRLEFRAGVTYSNVHPFVLKEASNSWLINSIWGVMQNPDYPFSAPVAYPGAIPMWGERVGISYSYRNRLHIDLSHSQVTRNLSRSDPTSVIFFNPANNIYTNSIYEGVRLLGYRQKEDRIQLEYVHPIFSQLRVGGYIVYEKYLEENNFSFGSYTLTKGTANPPLQNTWSIGGSTQENFHMTGAAPGAVARYYPWDWLEVIGRVEFISRKGSFDLSGLQLLQRKTYQQTNDQYLGLLAFYGGDVKESGVRTRIEAVFRFCRFSVHTGVIHEQMQRKYGSYLGSSFAPIQDFSAKTAGPIGFAEMSNKYPSSKNDIFIEPAVSVHF